jgi:hypothetical protein
MSLDLVSESSVYQMPLPGCGYLTCGTATATITR